MSEAVRDTPLRGGRLNAALTWRSALRAPTDVACRRGSPRSYGQIQESFQAEEDKGTIRKVQLKGLDRERFVRMVGPRSGQLQARVSVR